MIRTACRRDRRRQFGADRHLRREPEADAFLCVIAAADGCQLSSVSPLETNMVLAGRLGDATLRSKFDSLVARSTMQVIP
jgi:ribonuclease VapC